MCLNRVVSLYDTMIHRVDIHVHEHDYCYDYGHHYASMLAYIFHIGLMTTCEIQSRHMTFKHHNSKIYMMPMKYLVHVIENFSACH